MYSGSSWDDDRHQGGDVQVPPTPPISAPKPHTYAQRAHNTHSPPVYLYLWVDIPAIAFW